MSGRILLICACVLAVTLAVDVSSRPKPCTAGTTYKKDCNTCTCAADGKDKCGQVDCSRAATTAKPSSNGNRPGDCPTLVTPAPGSDVCSKRSTEDVCKKDSDCGQAKKCCIDGCNRKLCRNAIYRYTR